MVCGEHFPGPAEPGGDLVEDQQYVVTVADRPQIGQIARVVEPHSAGALNHRFDDHSSELVCVRGQLGLEGGDVAGVIAAGNRRCEHLLGQHVAPQRMHTAVGVADAHGSEGVPVIAAAPRHQAVLGEPAGAAPVLQRHLDRDLHTHRAGVGEEHRFRPAGVMSTSSLASRAADSWVSPPNMT